MFYIWENLEKKSINTNGIENVVPLKSNINRDSIYYFSKTKTNHEVVYRLRKSQSLFGNITKQEKCFHS